MHVPELRAENSCTGLTLPVSRAAHNTVTPGGEARAGFPVVSKEKEPEMEQEVLEGQWSKSREPDLTCARRGIPVIPYMSSSAHSHLFPQQHHPRTCRDVLPCPRAQVLLQSLGRRRALRSLQHSWRSRGRAHAAAGASTCLCSWAAAGKSIGSAGMFVLSQEGLAFQKRGEREQRKNWKGSRRK